MASVGVRLNAQLGAEFLYLVLHFMLDLSTREAEVLRHKFGQLLHQLNA